MTTNDEQYREVLGYYTRGRDEGYPLNPDIILNDGGDEYRAAFDRFLARVRRDAAREALDGLAREAAGVAEASNEHTNPWVSRVVHGWAEEYRDTHYPEETP